ncbi:MAG: methionine--tRNA ligase [Patescibacteria group bacterium]|nr:methionine--tRNA ligase [Patescibacteria group bacterium]
MNSKGKIFIGAALPYVNGSLHLGHVSSLIGADILARYFRLKGNDVLFVSGSDCHGTPIVVEAEKQNINPIDIVEKYDKEFRETLIDGLGFSYDLFSRTTSITHKEVVQDAFLNLLNKGYIYKKNQNLPYCEHCQRFLPDRYVEGWCPKCNFDNARGDQCDNCGNILDPNDLIKPRCKVCSGTPVWRDTEHFFLKLSSFQEELINWVKKSEGWRANATNFTISFLEGGLKDRAITRDSDWGVPIPLEGYNGKCIYVWFEAVCGYLSISKEWAKLREQKDRWQDYWTSEDVTHYYVHGKDNILFHTVIWPAILLGLGGLHLPSVILSSEYFTYEGKQFSKSRNWGVWLPEFLANYEPDTLRYYLVTNGPETADGNFSWKDYYLRTNSELSGKFGNFVNRVLSFINKNFQGRIPEGDNKYETDQEKKILESCSNIFKEVGKLIEQGKFREAVKGVFVFVDDCNKFINDNAPWVAIRSDKGKAGHVLNVCVQAISALQVVLNPFLPFSTEKIKKQLNNANLSTGWQYYPVKAEQKIGEVFPIYKKAE